jgi:hypothetical protein
MRLAIQKRIHEESGLLTIDNIDIVCQLLRMGYYPRTAGPAKPKEHSKQKTALSKEFGFRCAFCDTTEFAFGSWRNFHVKVDRVSIRTQAVSASHPSMRELRPEPLTRFSKHVGGLRKTGPKQAQAYL